MSEHAFDLYSPVIIATCLYFIASLFAAIEYYFSTNVSSLTSSASSTRLPSNHSHQINLEKQTRRPSLPSRKDPLDIGESMHSIGMRLPLPPSIPNLKRTPGEENRRLVRHNK